MRPGRRERRGTRPRRALHRRDGERARSLGRVERIGGALWFVPARRSGGRTRPLALAGARPPEPGDYVIAESAWDEPRAVLVEVLGGEDEPSWDNLSVLSRVGWPRTFQRASLEQAAHARPPAWPAADRADLRDRAAFTMDPADAADFDDALSWRDLGDGRAEVGIHVADVGHYVPAGTPLDADARARATSVYLPGQAVPMLPERLSSDLCSLRPGELRYTLSVLAVVSHEAEVLEARLVRGAIRSRARIAYEEGQAVLDGAPGPTPEVTKGLRALGELASRLTERRWRRGALDLETAEVKAEVDREGRPLGLRRRESLPAHHVVEEFMLLANQTVAERAWERSAPFLYRVHAPPPAEGLAALDAQLRALGLPRPGGGRDVAASLQALLAVRLPPPARRLVHQLVLRALSRAEYRHECAPHFGLALGRYAHFTSPIRRYPDLVNHRQVAGWIAGDAGRGGPEGEAWAQLALHTTAQEQLAAEAEREAVRVKGLRWIAQHLGDELEGTVSGVVPRGLFIELDDPPLDGFCRVEDAFEDRFEMDDAGVRLVGRRTRRRFGLGDRLRVVVARVDVPARELDLALVVPHAARHRPAGGRRTAVRRRKGGGRR